MVFIEIVYVIFQLDKILTSLTINHGSLWTLTPLWFRLIWSSSFTFTIFFSLQLFKHFDNSIFTRFLGANIFFYEIIIPHISLIQFSIYGVNESWIHGNLLVVAYNVGNIILSNWIILWINEYLWLLLYGWCLLDHFFIRRWLFICS